MVMHAEFLLVFPGDGGTCCLLTIVFDSVSFLCYFAKLVHVPKVLRNWGVFTHLHGAEICFIVRTCNLFFATRNGVWIPCFLTKTRKLVALR